ncbi:MAG: hypothetical protein PHF97_09265 [Bacteroidales bacterium]|nr:hypothetical protein [Bacteroidales bacterium]
MKTTAMFKTATTFFIFVVMMILASGTMSQTVGKAGATNAKTKEYGDLVLNFKIMLHDPVYTERVVTMDGSFDGQPLTNGGAWFERVFKGVPDGIKAVQDSPQIVNPLWYFFRS